MKNRVVDFFDGLIPRFFNNLVVICFFEIMRFWHRLKCAILGAFLPAKKRQNINGNAQNDTFRAGYIENQNSFDFVKYGKSTMKNAGCEVFAAYNAILSLTDATNRARLEQVNERFSFLLDMIGEFEKDGMVFSGRFGTSPKAIRDYFKRRGFVTAFSTNVKHFDDIGQSFSSLILTFYNDARHISHQVHTINISKDADGLWAHNVYCNGSCLGPYMCVSDVIAGINNGKAKGISIVGIRR